MSIEAMMWVKKHAPTKNATEMCILYALADRANDDGTGCWPYYETLADESRCSVPTIKRHIKALEERGLIVRGDQSQVSSYPKYRRPVVWDLNLKLRRDAEEVTYQSDTSRTRGINGDKAGYQPRQSEVSTATDRGITVDTDNHPSTTLPTSPEPSGHDHPPADRFDEFWEAVPRRVGKKKARTEWDKAIKEVDAGTIIDGMRRYRDDPNRVDAFTKHPSTWLSNGCWDDDPLPPREVPKPASRGGVENTLEAWGFVSEGSNLPWEDPAPTFDDTPFIDHQEAF